MAEEVDTIEREAKTQQSSEKGDELEPLFLTDLAQFAAAVALGFNLLGIIGWLADWDVVTSVMPGNYPVAPSSALLGFLLSSCILLRVSVRHEFASEFVVRPFVVILALMLGWVVVESYARTGFDLESLIAPSTLEYEGLSLIHMSPLVSHSYLAIALTLIVLMSGARDDSLVGNLASAVLTVVLCVGVIALLGYAYGSPLLYGGSTRPPAVIACVSVTCLSLAVMISECSGCPPVSLFRGDSIRARLTRVIIPATILVVLVNGWLYTVVSDALANPAILSSAVAVTSAIAMVFLVAAHARRIQADLEKIARERGNALESLEIANKKLGILGSITRHDSLNQLTILRGWLEVAKEADREGIVGDMIKKAEEAARAIQSQLEFTGSYEQIGIKAPRWLSVEKEFRDNVLGLETSHIRVTVEVHGLEVFADPMLGKVFRNLVDNTLMHGVSATTARLYALSSEESLTLVYEDDGIGIPGRDKARLFTRGYGKHTGYGLYLSKEILAMTGISIREVGAHGKGVRFEMIVPLGAYRWQEKHVSEPRERGAS